MNKWKFLGWKFLGLIGIVLLLLACGVSVSYLQAQAFVYNLADQRLTSKKTPADFGMPYANITLETEDGYHLAAWYIPSENRAAIILLHGYKNTREAVLPIAQMLARHGYGVILIDLRGHGESDGETLSFGMDETKDVEAASEYLSRCPDVDPERIGAVGVSFGGSVILLSAAENPAIKAVVAESAFASLEHEAPAFLESSGLPFFLAPWVLHFTQQRVGFTLEQVSAVDHIAQISPRPVFILQGGADLIVPPDSGQLLYDAAKEPRELWYEPGLGHAEFPGKMPEEYERQVVKFFGQYLLEK